MTKARTIANLGTGFTNISDTGTEGTKVASGTTAQRGSTTGQIRFNSTLGLAEYYNGTEFKVIDISPTVSSVDVTEVASDAGGNQTFIITGTGFNSGAIASFIGTSASFNANTTTVNSSTQITAVAPKASFLNAQEPYDIKVLNVSSLFGILENQINVDSSPAFNTASGSLGTIDHTQLPSSYSLTALSATDPDGDTVAYSKASGSLPSGLVLNSSTGAFSGNVNAVANTTTFNFDGRATANSKNTDRSFSIQQEGLLNQHGTQFAYSFNNSIVNQGSNTAVTATSTGSFNSNATGQTKFNAKSGHFPNSNTTGSAFVIPAHADLQFGTGYFTIEFWLYLVNDGNNVITSARIFQMGANDANGMALIYDFGSEFTFANSHTNILTDNPSNWFNAWHHFAVSGRASNCRLYRDGTEVSSTSSLNTITANANLYFGVYPGQATGQTRSNMFISELQITKGVEKYTSNFTPPTVAVIV